MGLCVITRFPIGPFMIPGSRQTPLIIYYWLGEDVRMVDMDIVDMVDMGMVDIGDCNAQAATR